MVRRFACTACGRCCDRGPEMELGEATALAGTFITSLLFKVHSLPLHERSRRAAERHRQQGGTRAVGPALAEERRHLARFTARETLDRSRGRSLHLTISALTVDREKGRCPALAGELCSIYAARPHSCRTVPLHYSRPPATLPAYLDRFVGTAGYRCDTSPETPIVLDGETIADPALRQAREEALGTADADRRWRDRLVRLMDEADAAEAVGLPTHATVLRHSDAGHATSLPMLVAWRVAAGLGLLSAEAFEQSCRAQVSLLEDALARRPDAAATAGLLAMLTAYELELAAIGRAARDRVALILGGRDDPPRSSAPSSIALRRGAVRLGR